MTQMARDAVDEHAGAVRECRFLLHDRDAKFWRRLPGCVCVSWHPLPQSSVTKSNLNAFAERWVRTVKEESLSHLILFGEGSLRRALTEFVAHFHSERNHQGKGNALLFPTLAMFTARRHVRCRDALAA